MSKPSVGELTTEKGFKAHVVQFPSGLIVVEWIPESVPDAYDGFNESHQSIYHDWDDLKSGVNIAEYEKHYP